MESKEKPRFRQTEIGILPEDWGIEKLKELGSPKEVVVTGPFGSLLHSSDYAEEGVPLLLVNTIEDGRLSEKEFPRVNRKKAADLKRFLLKEGDIVFTRVGVVGRTLYIDSSKEGWMFSGQTLRIRLSDSRVYNRFVEYYFRSPSAQSFSENTSLGTTRPSINTSILANRLIPLPPVSEQRTITKILLGLDSKIDLSRQMSRTLDTFGQAIFKRWFVDFEFSNEEGKPYKSSGGEMVYNEELGKEIPRKWRAKSLDEISTNFDFKRVPLSSRQREKVKGNYPYYGAAGILDYVSAFIFDGTYVLIGEDGTVVDERGYPFLQFVRGKFWVNNHAHVLQGKYISTELLYLLLKNTNVQHIVTGAVQPKINQANMNTLTFAIPDEKALNDLQGFIIKLRNIAAANLNQALTLSQIRDMLLPKLMSGRIRVPIQKENMEVSDA